MKKILMLEELAMTAVAVYLLLTLPIGFNKWWYIALFFTPDIGMLGYMVSDRVGAATYNLFHHKGIAIIIAVLGFFSGNVFLMATGLILFGHASFDRIMGYGLKYVTGFKNTHLGTIK